MDLTQGQARSLFAILFVVLGVYLLWKGEVTIGAEGDDASWDRVVGGRAAKLLAVAMIVAGFVVPVEPVVGFLIAIGAAAIAWFTAK